MHSTPLLEAFGFLRRTDLDACQLLSKQMRGFVRRNKDVLALRSFAHVGLCHQSGEFVGWIDQRQRHPCHREYDFVGLEAGGPAEFRQHAYSRSYEVESFERLFALVNNAFIQYLSGVYLGSSHETFLLYLVDRAKLVNIRVGTAEIEHSEEYAAAEFFASSMKPRHLWGWLSATPLSLFKSTAFRDCVKVLTASCDARELPSPTFLFVDNRLRRFDFDVSGRNSPYDWVNQFVEEFEAATVVGETFESVQLKWTVDDDFDTSCKSLRHKPTCANVPIPKDFVVEDFDTMWEFADYCGEIKIRKSKCALYSFKNSAAHRRLNIFNWVTSALDYKIHAFFIVLERL